MRYGSRESSTDPLRPNVSVNAFPQVIFFNAQTNPTPPYLVCTSEPTTTAAEEEADAAAGTTTTQSVLKRVSSLSIMSRVSTPRASSSLSLSDLFAVEPSMGGMGAVSHQHHVPHGGSMNYGHSSAAPSLDRNNHPMGATSSRPGALPSSHQDGRPHDGDPSPSWRVRDRMKTVGVGLVMALNVPEIVKPHSSAATQCWMDLSSVPRQKAKELIGVRLEAQYARWQQKKGTGYIKYRRAIDPTIEDVRALCIGLRKAAGHERVLFHYNGHGVPRPTANGEIWVFDQNYSLYIPLPVVDLRFYLGKPSIVVLDCNSAGVLIPFLTQKLPETPTGTPPATPQFSAEPIDVETSASNWLKDTIVLCPTSEGESLPMHPDYPADIFTCCLTTPIQIALRWFVRHNQHSMGTLNPEAVDAIPGQASERSTPLGELNWIFTAVTDSIAWDIWPKPLFRRLFRQDLLVASLFRNFLLADRILRSLNCTPQSYPPLPPGVADHPMWQAWDLACETCLFGLMKDGILGNHVLATTQLGSTMDNTGAGDATSPSNHTRANLPQPQVAVPHAAHATSAALNINNTTGPVSSISSPFFSEQLTAFEIWLEYAERHDDMVELELESPEQLPIVLQVLLSQFHRVRALELLLRFLQLGPWAVNLALSVGIYPYVTRLMKSPEYKSLLVNIWASILKFDPSCQVELVRDGLVSHFIQPLADWANPQADPLEAAKRGTLAAFCLAATCYRFPEAQIEGVRHSMHVHCVDLLTRYSQLEEQYQEQLRRYQKQQQQTRTAGQMLMPLPQPTHLQLLPSLSRIWLCICIGNMLQKSQPAQQEAYHLNVHICLLARLREDDAQVRSAAAFALGCFLDYAPNTLPPYPPAMSLGPGVTPHLAPNFQPNQQMMMSQYMTARTMTVPTALTASAVLAGHLQPSMGQVQPNMIDNRGVVSLNPSMWPPGAQIPTGQMLLGGQPTTMTMQPHGIMPQMQGQGTRIQPAHGNASLPVLHQMQPFLNANPVQQTTHHPHPKESLRAMPMGQLSDQIPSLRLGGHPMPGIAQQQLFNQQSMFRPQQLGVGGPILGAHIMTAGGHQLMTGQQVMTGQLGQRVTLGQQPLLMGQIPGTGYQQDMAPNLPPRPSVYEDRRRCELDVSIVEHLLNTSSDGSVEVRYEALMALSNFVSKYFKAFMVIAERGLGFKLNAQSMGDFEADNPKETSFAVPLPNGLNQILADRLSSIWQGLREVQRTDAHPRIQELSTSILRMVNEKVMDAKLEFQEETVFTEAADSGLAGIAEEEGLGTQERSTLSPDPNNRRIKATQPHSAGPAHRFPEMTHLRRTSSELGALYNKPNPHSRNALRDSKSKSHENKDNSELPKSAFYSWKKCCFDCNLDDQGDEDIEDMDPLNPNGVARAYRHHRNSLVQKAALKIANYFEPLKPKAPQPRKESDLILEESDDNTDDKHSSALKSELTLKGTKLLKRNSARMPTMLKFHSYEDVLISCDDQDGISIWDYERGTCIVSFKNGNKRGTRMTSSCWMNEKTKSHFFVGCNDGTAHVWSNIFEDDGHISSGYPTLRSAFVAVSDMQTTDKGSGMICEWQQFTGSLIAGGHSKNLRIWDLHTEKCGTSLEIGTTAAITSLTTAWDEDLGAMNGGYSGMGPDLVVAGHSNGSLQLFDIRGRNEGVQTGGRTRRHWNFDEHRGWIVNTFFTSYGGRFEILSGSVSGDIKAWDLRSSTSLRTLVAQRTPMTAMTVHRLVPFAATGSPQAQFIKISNLDGEALQLIRVHDEMPGHRIGPVSCLEFHKQKLILAAGATNSLVSIYQPKDAPRFS